ncbi:MAG: carboxypeptidase regulatory-like domain-containing protein [Planctomycetes bacterium]|nr:carboxypeptidase regulatory-like domain-containing protein [Planctomycetota bacterium]
MLKRLGAIAFVGVVAWLILSWSWPSLTSGDPTFDALQDRLSEAPPMVAEATPRVEVEAPAAGTPPDASVWPPPILPLLSRPGEPTGRLMGFVFDPRGLPVARFTLEFRHPRRNGATATTNADGLYQLTCAADTWTVIGRPSSRQGHAYGGTSFGEVDVVADRTTTFNVHLAGDAKLIGNAHLDTDAERDHVVNVRLLDARTLRVVGVCETTGDDPLAREDPEDRPPLADRPAAKRPGYFAFHGLAHGRYILSIRPAWQVPPEAEPYFTYQERPIDLNGDLELPTMAFQPEDFGRRRRVVDESSK